VWWSLADEVIAISLYDGCQHASHPMGRPSRA
jgi:hypothetical protein